MRDDEPEYELGVRAYHDDEDPSADRPVNDKRHFDEAGVGEDNDEELDGHDDHGALLPGPSSRPRGTKHIRGAKQQVWPQVRSIVLESAPTLLLTTVSLLFTGELLDHVSRWRAMHEVDQLIMIIPVILNLKGNLEMNLSARLGTAANVGLLDVAPPSHVDHDEDRARRKDMITGNLTLLQLQAAGVSFIAAGVAMVLGLIVPKLSSVAATPHAKPGNASNTSRGPEIDAVWRRRPIPTRPPPLSNERRNSGFPEFIMLASTSMTSAALSSLVLGSFMCFLIVMCRRFGRDPDNIAPPIASCLGDLITLLLLGIVSNLLIPFLHKPLVPPTTFIPLITTTVFVLTVVSASVCYAMTRRNEYVRDLMWVGWSPLLGAMVISSATGIVLDLFVSRYEGFAVLAVVISGLPGSVGSIFVSRLSTSLHAAALASSPSDPSGVESIPLTSPHLHRRSSSMSAHHHTTASAGYHHIPTETTTDDDVELFQQELQHQQQQQKIPAHPSPKMVATTLMLITLPVEIIFLSVLHWLGWLKLPFGFVALSLVFFCVAVVTALLLAYGLTTYLWSRRLDPDMYALPIHSALMDLIGQLLLVICFEIVQAFGGKVALKGASGSGG